MQILRHPHSSHSAYYASTLSATTTHNSPLQAPGGTHEVNDSEEEGALDLGYYALHATRLFLMLDQGCVSTDQQIEEVLHRVPEILRSESWYDPSP